MSSTRGKTMLPRGVLGKTMLPRLRRESKGLLKTLGLPQGRGKTMLPKMAKVSFKGHLYPLFLPHWKHSIANQ